MVLGENETQTTARIRVWRLLFKKLQFMTTCEMIFFYDGSVACVIVNERNLVVNCVNKLILMSKF